MPNTILRVMIILCIYAEYEEPVALLYLDTQNTFVNVYGVFVDEKLRGKGIGTYLMKHFLKDYFNIASLPLVLNVTSRNKAAVALYEKMRLHRSKPH
ncbi:MAG: GNAT family N-acetyltransferase [Lachnospira eligens]